MAGKPRPDDIQVLKDRVLEYYRALPIKKLAIESIGRSYDALNEWETSDAIFARKMFEAKAAWAREKSGSKRVEPSWLLGRVMKEHFSERTEHTGADGEKLEPLVIIRPPSDGS